MALLSGAGCPAGSQGHAASGPLSFPPRVSLSLVWQVLFSGALKDGSLAVRSAALKAPLALPPPPLYNPAGPWQCAVLPSRHP